MARKNWSVDVRLFKRPAEADGSACLYCGDAIYLKSWAIEVLLYDRDGKLVNTDLNGTADGKLCQACGDARDDIPVLEVPARG